MGNWAWGMEFPVAFNEVEALRLKVAVLMSEFAVFNLNVEALKVEVEALRLKVAVLMSEFAVFSLNVAPLSLNVEAFLSEFAALSLNVEALNLKVAAFLSHAEAQRRKEEDKESYFVSRRVCCRAAQRTTHHLKYFTLHHHTSFPHSLESYGYQTEIINRYIFKRIGNCTIPDTRCSADCPFITSSGARRLSFSAA
ncbi:hypothetical protein [Tolypothrix tenuis]|uniref:hypothetical protein n=1 Tax=Tolypothrix tenuis TaxID=457083 RepID=UPI002AA5AC52